MHILYEIEHLSTTGGIERILTDKANYIVENWGWDVSIVVLLEEEPVTAYPISPRVHIHYLNVKSKGIMMCLEALWKLNKLVNQLKPDVYVTFQTIGAMSCFFRTHHTPTIYEAHGIRTCMQHPFAMSLAEKHADCIVTLTDKNAKRYNKAKRTVVISNFTNIEPNNLPDYSKAHCVTIGRLDYEKNFIRLIDIWSVIHKSHSEWILDIYGEGPEYDRLQEQIDFLELSDSVILHGLTNNPLEAYQTSSIFLLTSQFEGFGLVLIEAQSCEVPCIAFDCDDGPREIIEDGKTGYLIPYDDDQAFIDKLLALMDDEALRRKMGEAAKVASRHYQAASIMEQWLKLFNDLTNFS